MSLVKCHLKYQYILKVDLYTERESYIFYQKFYKLFGSIIY